MKKLVFLNAMLAFSLAALGQQNYDTVRIRPFKVTENIYMLLGAGGNIGVMIGREGTLMIDDQFGPLSNKINGAIKTLDPGEIRFLINTHIHGDHTGGNENFKRMGITIVAHDAVRDRMMKESANAQTKAITPPRNQDAWPVITFGDKMNFHLNDEDIELIHFDPGHTETDVIVHFKKANVFHMGDAYGRNRYPFIDQSNGGTVGGYISTLDKALALMNDESKVIPGHGDLASKSDVKKFRDQLVDIRDQVGAALKKGKKVEDIPAMGITDKYDAEFTKGFARGKDFVLLMAEYLKGQMKK